MDKYQAPLRLKQNKSVGGPSSPKTDELLQTLVGATIVGIGFSSAAQEGGLTIDYLPPNANLTRRLILGYTDLGLWVEWHGKLRGK